MGELLLDEFPPVCRRMGAGFSGGLGGTRQELCGALSGGVLAIGALLGRNNLDEDDHAAVDVSALYRVRFLGRFGDTQCAPLRDRVRAPGGLGTCAILVEQATRLLLEMLARSPYVR